MQLLETDEHRLIRESVIKLCSEFSDDYWEEKDRETSFPFEFFDAMAQAGWIGIAMPEEYGGAGKGIQEAAIVLEEVAASGAAMNGATPLHLSIFGMHPVVKHGSIEMREKYLPDVARGKLHVAFGVTEPNAGSDTTSIETFARRDGDRYLVKGRKIWTTKAIESQKVLLLVRTQKKEDVDHKTGGMTLLLADLQRPEVAISPIPKLGRNAVRTCEVVYEDLEVKLSDRVGEEGKGFRYLLDGLNAERILIASECIGDAKYFIDKASKYANERIVFGRPIGKNQSIQFPLAQIYANTRAAELMVKEACSLYDKNKKCGEESNLAKLLAADASWEAADTTMQIFGGFSFSEEYNIERKFRETRLYRIAPISTNMILAFISHKILGLPRSY